MNNNLKPSKIKLILAIRALDIGGAERQFLELVKKIDRAKFDVLVVTTHKGALDKEIEGYPYFNADKNGRWDFKALVRLRKKIREFKAQAIYTFMPDMNITLALLKFTSMGNFKLIWGQFGSEPNFADYGKIRRRVYEVQQKLEFMSDALISDGFRGIEFLKKFRHKLENSTVIVSGTDVVRFSRNEEDRIEFRTKHHLTDSHIAIGICSRLDPMKGYHVLAKAAKRILAKYPNVSFYSIGYGQDSIINDAMEYLGEYSNRFTWFGKQSKPEWIMSGWDIYCSSSLYGEGFSNSIIEAMACSLPVIATDVGDARYQVEGVGLILEPGDDEALFNSLDNWLNEGAFKQKGIASKERAIANFRSTLMAKKTEDFILKIVEGAK